MKLRTLLITYLLLLVATSTVYAADTISESPHIKIIIDGQLVSYDDVPLIVNDRTMLPLRTVLTYLGVENDDEHIQWHSDDQSITIVSDTQVIWLQIGNNTAIVNGEDLTLDVTPIIYPPNNRTYIPARFISESLGKKVVWDGSTTSVLITEEERQAEVLAILEESNAAKVSEDYAFDLNYNLMVDSSEGSYETDMDILFEVNPQQKATHMDMAMLMTDRTDSTTNTSPETVSIEMYQLPDYTYVYMPSLIDRWIKSPTEVDPDGSIDHPATVTTDTFILEANELVAAGLIIDDTAESPYIHLKGHVYLEALLQDSLGLMGSDIDTTSVTMRKYEVDMSLMRNAYEFVMMAISLDMSMLDETGATIDIIGDITIAYQALEEGYEIIVPQEVIDTAFE